jgi:glycosyltransferase involved in cell wall biosynthesis
MSRDQAGREFVLGAKDGSWHLPRADVVLLCPKRNRYAVVIPVRNEGDRLRRQLPRMARFMDVCDIVITDAPSTDGSTEVDALREAGVHALVTLREPGGLSSSLRAGFAYALRAGFQGLILMDGNDKDDPAALPRFVEGLKAGFDFMQGSRYTVGGQAINTPLSRRLLIKFIHVPLFSALSGYRFTDTTNGFRGYSRRFLLDDRVRPFRNVFCLYELPYYLSWAASRYGFRVTEIPVTRAYPADGPIPTKITVFRGSWWMLKPLIMLLFRRY